MAVLTKSKRYSVGLIKAVLLLSCCCCGAATSLEYKFQAVYLFNFLQFTHWPNEAFSSADTPIVIGIMGKDPFGTALEEAVANENIQGRRAVIKHFKNGDQITRCHALYISRTEAARLDPILQMVGNASVLTVSDVEGFTDKGGAIEFFYERDRLRFEINRAAIKKSGLRLGSQLMKVARISGD